ncbi:MAG: enoyl-CoA hydratase-related protein [Vicinamibacterales bacterium]
MTFENLLLARDGAVSLLTLNRPSVLNALSVPLLSELDRALSAISDDATMRVVIITGAGDKAFAAGADITELAALSEATAAAHAAFGQRIFTRIQRLGKPVIAAVNGFALGGGCELALACTIRLASSTARLGQPEINLGIMPGFGGTQRLSRLIGSARALDLLLTGRLITAAEALEMGLVNRVLPPADLLRVAQELANELAARPVAAVRAILEAVYNGLDVSLDRGQEIESSLFGRLSATPDAREGMNAFLAKRTPRFGAQ